MYEDSQDPKAWYFFAVAGLNITSMILNLFETNAFDDLIMQNLHHFEDWQELINSR